MEDWMILGIVVFLASLLQASTGFGFSIIGTPFLFLLYPIHSAIQINIILSICLSAMMIFKIKNELDKPLLWMLMKGSLVGLVAGIFVYVYINIQVLKGIVGALIIILTILLILQITIKQTKKRDLLAGGISGLLTTSIGVPGPPLMLYFSGVGTNKVTLRSTTLAYYLFVYFASLTMQIIVAGTNQEVWTASVVGLPTLLMGIVAGQVLFKWISQKTFKIITYIILFSTGSYLLVTTF